MTALEAMWLWGKRISPGLFVAGVVVGAVAINTGQPLWETATGFALMAPEIVGQLSGKW